LADERLRQLDAPRLKLPEQVAWSFEARFGSLGHRLSAAQKRDLKRALASKPAGGCLVIAASADPRPIKSGYSIATNSELAALRAVGLLRGLQSLDKAAAQDSLILGLAEFQNLEHEAAEQRSAKVVWLPQACSALLDKSGAS
jgi:flagellar motor protein MotB